MSDAVTIIIDDTVLWNQPGDINIGDTDGWFTTTTSLIGDGFPSTYNDTNFLPEFTPFGHGAWVFEFEVPVYDGYDIPVNFAKDIDNLANILPAYISQDGEIPNGWCVLIAYTVSKFTARDKKESVGFNINAHPTRAGKVPPSASRCGYESVHTHHRALRLNAIKAAPSSAAPLDPSASARCSSGHAVRGGDGPGNSISADAPRMQLLWTPSPLRAALQSLLCVAETVPGTTQLGPRAQWWAVPCCELVQMNAWRTPRLLIPANSGFERPFYVY
ncbi:hypothetical protein FB451DRAFT_1453666 [Mycena latifolia]|nr:hypothetical protein FB451DRAFT_1453666 [Mycena latifolia]